LAVRAALARRQALGAEVASARTMTVGWQARHAVVHAGHRAAHLAQADWARLAGNLAEPAAASVAAAHKRAHATSSTDSASKSTCG